MQLTDEQRKAIEWAIGMASQHNIHNSPLRALLAAHSDGRSLPLSKEQKAALDLAVRNLKTHGDDQLLSAVTPLIEYYKSTAHSAGAQATLSEEVLMRAIADTAARGHMWASRALSNYRTACKHALVKAAQNYIGALDAWGGSAQAERYTRRCEADLRAELAELERIDRSSKGK